MRLTDEKIADENVSSENSDVEDYPLIPHNANGTMVNANARRRAKEAAWDETVRLLPSLLTFPTSAFYSLDILRPDKSIYYSAKDHGF